jgi:hypothetical protein
MRWSWIAANPASLARPPHVRTRAVSPPEPDAVLRLIAEAEHADPDLSFHKAAPSDPDWRDQMEHFVSGSSEGSGRDHAPRLGVIGVHLELDAFRDPPCVHDAEHQQDRHQSSEDECGDGSDQSDRGDLSERIGLELVTA